MREIVRYGLVLSIICLLAASILAYVYSITNQKIISMEKENLAKSLIEIFKDAKLFEPIKLDNEICYKAIDADNNLLGIIFKAKAKGYSSEIETLVGISKSGEIVGIKIISQNETPGLGSRITEKDFLNQFINRDINNLSDVNTITSATISSSAVIKSVEEKGKKIINLLKNE